MNLDDRFADAADREGFEVLALRSRAGLRRRQQAEAFDLAQGQAPTL